MSSSIHPFISGFKIESVTDLKGTHDDIVLGSGKSALRMAIEILNDKDTLEKTKLTDQDAIIRIQDNNNIRFAKITSSALQKGLGLKVSPALRPLQESEIDQLTQQVSDRISCIETFNKIKQAIQTDDEGELKQLVKDPFDINMLHPVEGQTLLHLCIENLNYDDDQKSPKFKIIEFLLNQGAQADLYNIKGRTPLHLLIEKDSVASLQLQTLMLTKLPLLDQTEPLGIHLSHFAERKQDFDFIKLLKKQTTEKVFRLIKASGLSVEAKDACEKILESPHLDLDYDLKIDNLNLFELCELPENTFFKDKISKDQIFERFLKVLKTGDSSPALKQLKGISDLEFLNKQDPNGYTLAHLAIKYRHLEVVQMLAEKGVDFDTKNIAGQTPLSDVWQLDNDKGREMEDGKEMIFLDCVIHSIAQNPNLKTKDLIELITKHDPDFITKSNAVEIITLVGRYRLNKEMIPALLSNDIDEVKKVLKSYIYEFTIDFKDENGKNVFDYAQEGPIKSYLTNFHRKGQLLTTLENEDIKIFKELLYSFGNDFKIAEEEALIHSLLNKAAHKNIPEALELILNYHPSLRKVNEALKYVPKEYFETEEGYIFLKSRVQELLEEYLEENSISVPDEIKAHYETMEKNEITTILESYIDVQIGANEDDLTTITGNVFFQDLKERIEVYNRRIESGEALEAILNPLDTIENDYLKHIPSKILSAAMMTPSFRDIPIKLLYRLDESRYKKIIPLMNDQELQTFLDKTPFNNWGHYLKGATLEQKESILSQRKSSRQDMKIENDIELFNQSIPAIKMITDQQTKSENCDKIREKFQPYIYSVNDYQTINILNNLKSALLNHQTSKKLEELIKLKIDKTIETIENQLKRLRDIKEILFNELKEFTLIKTIPEEYIDKITGKLINNPYQGVELIIDPLTGKQSLKKVINATFDLDTWEKIHFKSPYTRQVFLINDNEESILKGGEEGKHYILPDLDLKKKIETYKKQNPELLKDD